MDHTVHTVATVDPRGTRGTGDDSRRSRQHPRNWAETLECCDATRLSTQTLRCMKEGLAIGRDRRLDNDFEV